MLAHRKPKNQWPTSRTPRKGALKRFLTLPPSIVLAIAIGLQLGGRCGELVESLAPDIKELHNKSQTRLGHKFMQKPSRYISRIVSL